jgi:hypothetical protein
MRPARVPINIRGKETVIEQLKGAVISGTLVKARSVSNRYNFFYLDYGGDVIDVYPSQVSAHKAFIKRDNEQMAGAPRA